MLATFQIKLNNRVLRAIALSTSLAIMSQVNAFISDTMVKVAVSGELVAGYAVLSPPFSYKNSENTASGFHIELCTKIFEGIKAELQRPDLKLKFVMVDKDAGFEPLLNVKIDIDCSPHTNSLESNKVIDFSINTYIANIKILTPASIGIKQIQDLKNMSVVTEKGSLATPAIKILSERKGLGLKINDKLDAHTGFQKIMNRQVDAVIGEEAFLLSMANLTGNPANYALINEKVTQYPIALAMRKDEKKFTKVVDNVISKLMGNGEYVTLYNRWFNNNTIHLPMNPQQKENIKWPSKQSSFH